LSAIQGLTAIALGHRLFMRVSAGLQLAAFFVVLGAYFLKPPVATAAGIFGSTRPLLTWLPSLWFLALFERLSGAGTVFAPLALRGLWGMALTFLLAAASFALGYRRSLRGLIEQPDIAPSDRIRPLARTAGFLAAGFLPRPAERAVLLFTARTLARSRQHRLLLAAYAGIGLAMALAYARDLIYGDSEHAWSRPNAAFLAASGVVLFFGVIGVRAVMALPVSLRSNWVFRIATVQRPSAYFSAARKSLLMLVAAPIWISSGVLCLIIWPAQPALEHIAMLAALGVLLVYKSLYKFRKIPFACSYLPGKANLHVRLGACGIIFLFLTDRGSQLELWSLDRAARFILLLAVLLAVAARARRRTIELAASPLNQIQFEDLPPVEVFALDLRRDGTWLSDEAKVEAIDPHFGRSRVARARPFVIGALLLLACGLVYERIGERRDQRYFPQVGRSVNIGDRALNIDCLGEGSPTVVLESNWGEPGYRWLPIQRQIAKYTRACWYDRAGYGWSDPGPFPNHSDSAAHDLHRLLGATPLPPPYVLVGYSMGGFHVRVFHGFYPSEVAGMVLVDPMPENMTLHIHNHIESFRPLVVHLFQLFDVLGWYRLTAPDPGSPANGWTANQWATLSAMRRRSIPAQPKEPPLWVNGELARSSGGLGDLPLIVLSPGVAGRAEDPKLEDHPWKLALQHDVAALSSRGSQLVVQNSGHEIPSEAPSAVVNAIREVVTEVRAE
jgi:pimeloyl-ACP methyl ester carboxylesterase